MVRFSKDEAVARDLVRLNDVGVVGTDEQEPLTRATGCMGHVVRRGRRNCLEVG